MHVWKNITKKNMFTCIMASKLEDSGALNSSCFRFLFIYEIHPIVFAHTDTAIILLGFGTF